MHNKYCNAWTIRMCNLVSSYKCTMKPTLVSMVSCRQQYLRCMKSLNHLIIKLADHWTDPISEIRTGGEKGEAGGEGCRRMGNCLLQSKRNQKPDIQSIKRLGKCLLSKQCHFPRKPEPGTSHRYNIHIPSLCPPGLRGGGLGTQLPQTSGIQQTMPSPSPRVWGGSRPGSSYMWGDVWDCLPFILDVQLKALGTLSLCNNFWLGVH